MVKFLLFLKKGRFKLNNCGITLIELLAVLAILSILAAIAVPTYIGFIEKAEKEVCNSNSSELERLYNAYLELEVLDHTDVLFLQYMSGIPGGICPSGGDISYTDGKVDCSIHPRSDDSENQEDNDDDGSVPYL